MILNFEKNLKNILKKFEKRRRKMSRKINVRVTMDADSREVVRMFYKTTYFGTPNAETLNFDEWAGDYIASTVKYFSSSPELYKEYLEILNGEHSTSSNDKLTFMSK